MSKYIVSQTFETLGDTAKSTHGTRAAAEAAAETLRSEIAEMVAGWETPDSYSPTPTGYAKEINAWNAAEKMAGVNYDDDGERTAASPAKWGAEVGAYIANLAVEIETVD